MYLYFLRSTGFLMFIISFISIIIILPLFAAGDGIKNSFKPMEHENIQANYTVDFIQTLTVKNVYSSDQVIYLVLILSYIITFMAYYHVYNYQNKLMLITENENENESRENIDTDASLHSLHIRGLNKNLNYKETEKVMNEFLNMCLVGHEVLSIQVIPNYDKIIELIDQKFNLESTLNQLERKNFNRLFSNRIKMYQGNFLIDSELYMREKIKVTNHLLDFYRKLIVRKNTGSAFITFRNPSIVNSILKNKNIFLKKQETVYGALLSVGNWTIGRAPAPSDILWHNIKYSKIGRIIKMILMTGVLFYLCLRVITPQYVSLYL